GRRSLEVPGDATRTSHLEPIVKLYRQWGRETATGPCGRPESSHPGWAALRGAAVYECNITPQDDPAARAQAARDGTGAAEPETAAGGLSARDVPDALAGGGGGGVAGAGRAVRSETGGDAGDGRFGRGGRGVHANAVPGSGLGGDVRFDPATIGGGGGLADCGVRGGGDGEHAGGDDALTIPGDDHGLRDLAGLFVNAAADAGVRSVDPGGAPVASRVHLHRATAAQRVGRAAGAHGIGSRGRTDGRGYDAGARGAGARDSDVAGDRGPVPDEREQFPAGGGREEPVGRARGIARSEGIPGGGRRVSGSDRLRPHATPAVVRDAQ